MEMEHTNIEKAGLFASALGWLKDLPKRWISLVSESAMNLKKLGKDDPRRVIHSLKVGLALALVSILYYYRPLYKSFGVTAMWAIMTVVVIFEFSVGAMLCKGLNRAVATLIGGALGVGAHYLSSLFGPSGEPVVIGFCVFIQAAVTTFLRFFPKIKARYDYGMLIFILTFSLISVSAVRYDEIYEMAHKRLSTIVIGALVCILISIFLWPVWAGEDLHNLLAANMEKLADFLEASEGQYSKTSEDGDVSRDIQSYLVRYKSVINSKSMEESLANFARWEPGHGKFKFRHPWKQYLTVGAHIRECACRIEVLHGQLNADNYHESPEVLDIIKEECSTMSLESSKALRQLALDIKSWTHQPTSAKQPIENSKTAAKNLNSLFLSNSWQQVDLAAVMPTITVATLLIDIVACTEKIAESVYRLSSLASFKDVTSTKSTENSKVQPCDSTSDANGKDDCSHVAITIKEDENGKP